MLKLLAVPVLGLVVLAGVTTTAAADRGRGWNGGPYVVYAYPDDVYDDDYDDYDPYDRPVRRGKKFNPDLDFETEAVWRNLRPEWFD